MTIVVKPGDTLWAIAKNELGDPQLWSTIYAKNQKTIMAQQQLRGRRHLRGPDWIYPGTVLEI